MSAKGIGTVNPEKEEHEKRAVEKRQSIKANKSNLSKPKTTE